MLRAVRYLLPNGNAADQQAARTRLHARHQQSQMRCSALDLAILRMDGYLQLERFTGALLGSITHHIHILEMNADSYHINKSRRKCA